MFGRPVVIWLTLMPLMPSDVGGVDAVVRLERRRKRSGVAGAELVDDAGTHDLRVVEGGAVGGQPCVLNSGDERSEIETRGGLGRRRQAARGLALRRIEAELAIVEPGEERVVAGEAVVDTGREGVVLRLAVHRRGVVVEIAGAVRHRVDAGDIAADAIDLVSRDDVARILVAQELRVGGADREPRVEVRVEPRGQRIVDEDQVPARVPEVAEVTDPCRARSAPC